MSEIIDVKTGELTIKDPAMVVSNKTILSDFEGFKDLKFFKRQGKKLEYVRCTIGMVVIGENKCRPTFYFEKERLYMIQFSPCPFDYGEWKNWSEENQIKIKEWNDEWLLNVMGKKSPYKYKWGRVSSVFDIRSGSSDIFIVYPENRSK